jgi:hypothetical protein
MYRKMQKGLNPSGCFAPPGGEILDSESDAELVDQDPITDMDSYSNLDNISSDDTIGLYLKEMSRCRC